MRDRSADEVRRFWLPAIPWFYPSARCFRRDLTDHVVNLQSHLQFLEYAKLARLDPVVLTGSENRMQYTGYEVGKEDDNEDDELDFPEEPFLSVFSKVVNVKFRPAVTHRGVRRVALEKLVTGCWVYVGGVVGCGCIGIRWGNYRWEIKSTAVCKKVGYEEGAIRNTKVSGYCKKKNLLEDAKKTIMALTLTIGSTQVQPFLK